jgi:hypothetical protein
MAEHLLEGVKDEFMGSQSKLPVSTGFFIKRSGDSFFEFAVWVGAVSPIEAQPRL